MKIFISDNVPKIIEEGLPLSEHYLWSNKTQNQGKLVYWLGAEPNAWLIIAGHLFQSGPEGKAIAEAIASEFGMIRKESDK